MANVERVSSNDFNYTIGDLSNYPDALDTIDSLFTVVNSGLTSLSAPMSFDSEVIPCKDTSLFPSQGLVSIDKEVIYYQRKNTRFLAGLVRGYSGKRSNHEAGAEVKAAVCSDHHNAIRDAILAIEAKAGLYYDGSTAGTMYGRLKALETKFLSLKSVFNAWPLSVQPGDVVSFRDLSVGSPVTWLWDFGDGTNSTEQNPYHRYPSTSDGSSKTYDVTLLITDIRGVTATVKKNGYVQVGLPEVIVYVPQTTYSLETGGIEVTFTDQTPGIINKRSWSFGDGGTYLSSNPMENSVTHTYKTAGSFRLGLSLQIPGGIIAGPKGTNEIIMTITE